MVLNRTDTDALLRAHLIAPRRAGDLPDATGTGAAAHPACGDRVRFQVRVTDGRIDDLRFRAAGCPAALAVASFLADLAAGRRADWARTLRPDDLLALLPALPAAERHAARLAVEALRAAVG